MLWCVVVYSGLVCVLGRCCCVASVVRSVALHCIALRCVALRYVWCVVLWCGFVMLVCVVCVVGCYDGVVVLCSAVV